MPTTAHLLSDLDDQALMRRVQRDDVEAFACLYERTSARAFGLARRIAATSDDAEEALQEAYTTAWLRRASYMPSRAPVVPWLLMIVRNRAIDGLRKSSRRHRHEHGDGGLDSLASVDCVETAAIRHEDAAVLAGVMTALPAEQQQVLDLAFFAGLTHTEIATRLAIPVGTVKGRMRLGLTKARRAIEPLDVTERPAAAERHDADMTLH